MISTLFYPPSTPNNILELMTGFLKQGKDTNYYIAICTIGIDNHLFLAISPNTNGLFLISMNYLIFDEDKNAEIEFYNENNWESINNIVKSHLQTLIKTHNLKNIKLHSKYIDINSGDINFWKLIESNEKTSNETFEFAKSLPEFNAFKIENKVEKQHIKKTSERRMIAISNILKQTILNTINDYNLTLNGQKILINDLVSPIGYLPVLLIHAAISWKPMILKNFKKDLGFKILLKEEKNQLNPSKMQTALGYEVMGIEVDKIPFLAMPIGNIIKNSIHKNQETGEYSCELYTTFFIGATWLANNNYNISLIYQHLM